MSEDSRRLDKLNKILELSNKKPTDVFDEYWVYALDLKHKHPKSKNPGKWLIFVDVKEIDDVWKKIKEAVEEGILWRSAKVATMRPNAHATDQNTKVICVYTYDWTDEADVMRIREELRKLGIMQKIPYKADEDTYEGKYRVKGHTRISKYYC